jgi:ATP-dependent RNA helicase SUPV3L1/SUV3
MMSLVGCSEPEMADVLRGLGYRVLPPTEEGGLHSFSVKPRFLREREEQRERQRQQQRQYREQHRRERPDRPNERQFFADSLGRDGPRRDHGKPQGPRPDSDKGAPREDRRDERPRGPRPPRRDAGGPALRLYATTEKKGDNAADSPFAKLLELKLGGKK